MRTRRRDGGDLYFHRPRTPVLDLWRRTGFIDELGADHVFPTKRIAIATIFDRLDRGICAHCTIRVFEECRDAAAAHAAVHPRGAPGRARVSPPKPRAPPRRTLRLPERAERNFTPSRRVRRATHVATFVELAMPTRRLALAFLAAVASMPALAIGNLVDVQLIDRSQGHLLDTWQHRGVAWVAGQPGNRYAIQLTNRTDARVLVVLSVDGVNAISGETAAPGQTGYVLGPRSSAEITGWRKSWSEAAAFYFTSLPDSYAARTDRPENVGVIGAAIFRERTWRPQPRFDAAPPVAGRSAAPGGEAMARAAEPEASSESRDRSVASGEFKSEQRLGTGHGEREYSPTSQVAFERASRQPAEIVKVRYDSHRNLVALGVVGGRPEPVEPQPFPRFAADPR